MRGPGTNSHRPVKGFASLRPSGLTLDRGWELRHTEGEVKNKKMFLTQQTTEELTLTLPDLCPKIGGNPSTAFCNDKGGWTGKRKGFTSQGDCICKKKKKKKKCDKK